ncbi:MAG: acyltransferase family protein [Terriglobia bacterium]
MPEAAATAALNQTKSTSAAAPPAGPSQRVMSVDALRGFDMFWIAGGQQFVIELLKLFSNPLPPWLDRQFDHVEWEGFVGWDLIMPLFLFIVGVAMPFSIGKRLARGDSRGSIYKKMIYRVVMLWILGMVAQGHLLLFDSNNLQFYSNTLQAIAAGYLIATIALVELPIKWQGALAGALLLAFWALMELVPVPGHGAGVLTPDGNLAMYIDKALLGRFQDGTTYTWILSSLGFGATVLMGVLSGHLLKSTLPQKRKAAVLAGAGLACLAVGWVWSFAFPIIKHIWTSSMVLWSGGWCLLLLAFFYYVIDVLGYRRWAFFFTVIGMNAIVAYMAPDIIPFSTISKTLFAGLASHLGMFGPVLVAFGTLGVLWIILYYLYRNRTFVRI